METAQEYLERCLDLLKRESVSETTMIIMFHEYSNLIVKEKHNYEKSNINNNKKENPLYGC